ncbi:hypothetical protein ANTRET_LOCUS5642 [Anthophora retusa]
MDLSRASMAESISISPQALVFTAECLAISRALDIIRDHPNTNFIICTDSLTCLSTLQNPNRKHIHNPQGTKRQRRSRQNRKGCHHDSAPPLLESACNGYPHISG